jgi:hypothetical protein
VRGIPGLVCPECGSDLREVGIIPAGGRHNPRGLRMIIWTLALPVPAIIISLLLLNSVLPFSQKLKVTRTIFCQAPYLNTILQLTGSQLLWQPAWVTNNVVAPREVTLLDQQHQAFIDIDLKTGGYAYRDKSGTLVQKPSRINGAVLADWLGTCGVNGSDPKVKDLADAVCVAINEVGAGNSNHFTPLNDKAGTQVGIAHPAFAFTVHDEPSPFVIAALVIFWIAVWIYGKRWLSRR